MDRAAIEDERPPSESSGADAPSSTLRRWLAAADAAVGIPRRWLAAVAVVAILAAAAAILIGRQIVSGPSSPARPKPAATTAPNAAAPQALPPDPAGFVRVEDRERGLSIALPKSWQRLPSSDDQVSVLATGDGASMLVRTAPLGFDVGPESIGAARKITDSLVRAVKQVKVVEGPKQVSVGGLPGYLYLYTYRDAATGQRGGHAHYFLFQHQSMVTIVFQVLPADRFAALGPLFDEIGRTLRTPDAASGQSGGAPSTAPSAR